MEIEWTTEAGEMVTGEIKMSDKWTVVKRTREAVQGETDTMRFSSQEGTQETAAATTGAHPMMGARHTQTR